MHASSTGLDFQNAGLPLQTKVLNLNSSFIIMLVQKLLQPQIAEILKQSQQRDNYELLPQISNSGEKDEQSKDLLQGHQSKNEILNQTLFDLLCRSSESLELGKMALSEYLSFYLQMTQQQIFFQEYNSKVLLLTFRALFNFNSDTSIHDILSLLGQGGQPQPQLSSYMHHHHQASAYAINSVSNQKQGPLQQSGSQTQHFRLSGSQLPSSSLQSQNNNLQQLQQQLNQQNQQNSQIQEQQPLTTQKGSPVSYMDALVPSSQQQSQINSLNHFQTQTNGSVNGDQSNQGPVRNQTGQQQLTAQNNGLSFEQLFLVVLFNLAQDCNQLAELLYLFGQQTFKIVIKNQLYLSYQELVLLSSYFTSKSQVDIANVLKEFGIEKQQEEIGFKQAELVLYYFVKEGKQSEQIRLSQQAQRQPFSGISGQNKVHLQQNPLKIEMPKYLKSQVMANQCYEKLIENLEKQLIKSQGQNAYTGSSCKSSYKMKLKHSQGKEEIEEIAEDQSQSQTVSYNNKLNNTKQRRAQMNLKEIRDKDKKNQVDSRKRCILI